MRKDFLDGTEIRTILKEIGSAFERSRGGQLVAGETIQVVIRK
jgi:hypothetical protein